MSKTDITEAMINAARSAAAPVPLTYDDARRILGAGLSKMNWDDRGATFPLRVSTTLEVKRARFLGVTERRYYYRVETEDGKELIVHANEISASKGPK